MGSVGWSNTLWSFQVSHCQRTCSVEGQTTQWQSGQNSRRPSIWASVVMPPQSTATWSPLAERAKDLSLSMSSSVAWIPCALASWESMRSDCTQAVNLVVRQCWRNKCWHLEMKPTGMLVSHRPLKKENPTSGVQEPCRRWTAACNALIGAELMAIWFGRSAHLWRAVINRWVLRNKRSEQWPIAITAVRSRESWPPGWSKPWTAHRQVWA